jgi:hypothetical protein
VNDRRVWETIRAWFLGRGWEGLEGTQHRVDYEMYLGGRPIDWGVFWFTVPWSERKLILRALESRPDLGAAEAQCWVCGSWWSPGG